MKKQTHPVVHASTQPPAELWQQRDILQTFYDCLKARGVAVDRRLFGLIYLALTSRLLPRPVCLVIKGSSGQGKSYAIDNTLEFHPACAYIKRTAVSDKAIIRSDESYAHRTLVLVEAKGMDSSFAQLMVQNLITDRRITYEVSEPQKDGSWKAVTLTKDGPIGMILATTKLHLVADLETRLLTVPVPDTPEYTREILKAYTGGRLRKQPKSDLDEWTQLQVWLETVDHQVRVPYLECLEQLCDVRVGRLRRDFPQLDSLIQAHALLHAGTRKRNRQGHLLARIRDYRAVYELVGDLLAQGAASSIRPEVRQTVEVVNGLMDDEPLKAFDGTGYVTVRQVAERLGLEHSAAWRRLAEASQLGLLQNLETRRWRPMRITLGDRLPNDRAVIPTPDDLKDAWRAWKARRK